MPQAKRSRKNNSIPEWENSRPQWEQQLGDSQARQPMNEIIPARQPMNEIVPAPGVRTPMNEIVPVQRTWASVNAPSPAQTTPVQTMNNGSNGVRSIPRNSTGRSNSVKWAAVNQPSLLPPPSQLSVHNNNGVGSNESGNRSNQDQDQGKREETVVNEEGSVALIDTFPKSKQRQVYGLVSGLQGGIENLQRELDTLKRALGIDDED
jgi:hypothetical protein